MIVIHKGTGKDVEINLHSLGLSKDNTYRLAFEDNSTDSTTGQEIEVENTSTHTNRYLTFLLPLAFVEGMQDGHGILTLHSTSDERLADLHYRVVPLEPDTESYNVESEPVYYNPK